MLGLKLQHRGVTETRPAGCFLCPRCSVWLLSNNFIFVSLSLQFDVSVPGRLRCLLLPQNDLKQVKINRMKKWKCLSVFRVQLFSACVRSWRLLFSPPQAPAPCSAWQWRLLAFLSPAAVPTWMLNYDGCPRFSESLTLSSASSRLRVPPLSICFLPSLFLPDVCCTLSHFG